MVMKKLNKEPILQLNIFERPVMEYSVGELVLHYKPTNNPEPRKQFRDTKQIADYVRERWITAERIGVKEYLYALFINENLLLTGVMLMSEGTRAQTLVDVGHVVVGMLLHNSRACVLVHNHPAGLSNPSQSDIKLTDALSKALAPLQMRLLDHIVITADDFTSIMASKKRKR